MKEMYIRVFQNNIYLSRVLGVNLSTCQILRAYAGADKSYHIDNMEYDACAPKCESTDQDGNGVLARG